MSMVQHLVDRLEGPGLSAVRIVVSFLFLLHGVAGLLGVLGKHAAPLFAWPLWWASLIQLVGGTLVLLGLFTRPAAVLCSGAMAYAYFSVHQPDGLFPLENGGVPAALYSWFFLLIAVLGAGPYSLDALLEYLRPTTQQAETHPRTR